MQHDLSELDHVGMVQHPPLGEKQEQRKPAVPRINTRQQPNQGSPQTTTTSYLKHSPTNFYDESQITNNTTFDFAQFQMNNASSKYVMTMVPNTQSRSAGGPVHMLKHSPSFNGGQPPQQFTDGIVSSSQISPQYMVMPPSQTSRYSMLNDPLSGNNSYSFSNVESVPHNSYPSDLAPILQRMDSSNSATGYGGMGMDNGRSGFDEIPICRFFKEGKCRRGEKCRFSHYLDGGPINEPATAPQKSETVCFYFNSSIAPCKFGRQCRYPHIRKTIDPDFNICWDFNTKWGCSRRKACVYLHQPCQTISQHPYDKMVTCDPKYAEHHLAQERRNDAQEADRRTTKKLKQMSLNKIKNSETEGTAENELVTSKITGAVTDSVCWDFNTVYGCHKGSKCKYIHKPCLDEHLILMIVI
eukprot:UN34049